MEQLENFFCGTEISLSHRLIENCELLAVDNLKKDLTTVFSKEVVEKNNQIDAEIVLLRYEIAACDASLSEKLNLQELKDEHGKLFREGFLLAVLDGTIYIVGNDKRGMIYGIYEFSQRIGVSPWHYFADIPIKQKNFFHFPKNFRMIDYPSVEYRGIFINDEEELEHWAKKHTDDGTIGPKTYQKVFELLLRLKANYIWPAMHVNFFNENPENGRLANEMGIIVGTSHCDMLLRSNQHEWFPWLQTHGYGDAGIEYDYSIPGKNRDILREYWTGSVEMNKDYDVSYTVGMRGIHDTGFITKVIDEDESLSEHDRYEQKKKLLEKVICDQREILVKTLKKDPSAILQTFVPYKEVLTYYDNGLQIPEDITIIWANDNYGNIRRYPNNADLHRSGGHGLYYHSSYWAPNNMHYLFINSTPLAKMKNELQKAWDNGIQKMWVLNVGSIKPIEQDLEFFMRFAWEIGKEQTTLDIIDFLAGWMNREFTGGIGQEVAQILNKFTQIVNIRKIEMMDPNTFSQVVFGDEAARRLWKLKELFDISNELAKKVAPNEKAGFFQLVQMKIHAAYYKNAEFYFADRSCLAYDQGKMQAAERYREISSEFTQQLRWMIYYYNKVMSDGKWDEILTPEQAPPPNMKMYPPTKPALTIAKPGLGVCWWQPAQHREDLVFSKGAGQIKWIEVFNKGAAAIEYQITAPEWLKLSSLGGVVTTEERILVELAENIVDIPEKGIIKVSGVGEEITIPVIVENRKVCKFAYERDGAISIPLQRYSTIENNNDDLGWYIHPYQGRYEG